MKIAFTLFVMVLLKIQQTSEPALCVYTYETNLNGTMDTVTRLQDCEMLTVGDSIIVDDFMNFEIHQKQ